MNELIKLAQKCVEQVPVVVLGSGASSQYGIGGMGALEKHLLYSVKPESGNETEVWEKFSDELGKINDFELVCSMFNYPSQTNRPDSGTENFRDEWAEEKSAMKFKCGGGFGDMSKPKVILRSSNGISLHRDECGELSGGAASGAHGGASVARLDKRIGGDCAVHILSA